MRARDCDRPQSCPLFLHGRGSTDEAVEFGVFFRLDLEQIGLVLGLLECLLILVLDFDVIFDLTLDLFVLFGEGALEQVDAVFFLVQIIVNRSVLLFISLQLLLQQRILLAHFGYVPLHLSHFSVNLPQSSLIAADSLC